MTIEINLATYDKQNEILRKLIEGGGEGYFYLLASSDSTAMATDIEALKGLKNIKSIVNSEAAMRAVINSEYAWDKISNSKSCMEAVANSTTAMEAVINSSTAMEALLNSKNTKTLKKEETITGKFLPLRSTQNSKSLQAYNGTWSDIGIRLGDWLLRNSSKPIATQIKNGNNVQTIYYYDLNA